MCIAIMIVMLYNLIIIFVQLQRAWQGPFLVTERINDAKMIKISPEAIPKVVHHHRLQLVNIGEQTLHLTQVSHVKQVKILKFP